MFSTFYKLRDVPKSAVSVETEGALPETTSVEITPTQHRPVYRGKDVESILNERKGFPQFFFSLLCRKE